MTISSFSYKSKYFFGATYGVCGLKNPTAKKKLCPFLENFSSCSTASVATIPSVCSSSSSDLDLGEITLIDNIGKDMVIKILFDDTEVDPGFLVPKKSKIDLVLGNGIKNEK